MTTCATSAQHLRQNTEGLQKIKFGIQDVSIRSKYILKALFKKYVYNFQNTIVVKGEIED